jgi:hypothetical protein
MQDLKDFLTGLVFGTILSSADKMGINPMLLGRQSSKVLGPMIGNLAQQTINKNPPKTMEELVKDLETFVKGSDIFGKGFELNYSGNTFSMKINECLWLEMCKYGKTIGYKACPLCSTMIIMMGLIEAMGISQVVGINVDNNEATCELKMAMEQK